MPLPPGCKLNYNLYLDVDNLTNNMVEWFEMIGGKVGSEIKWTRSGGTQNWPVVQYGKGKPSYRRQDGTNNVKINFHGDDASVASMFLLKFNEHVVAHNMAREFNLVK